MRTDRLCCILDDNEIMAATDIGHAVHLGRLAVEVNRDNGASAGRDAWLRILDINCCGACINVAEHRRRTDIDHAPQRRDEGLSWHQHLIAGADIRRDYGKMKRGGAAVDADRVRDSQKFRNLALESVDLRSQAKCTAREHLIEVQLGPSRNLSPLQRKIVEWDALDERAVGFHSPVFPCAPWRF